MTEHAVTPSEEAIKTLRENPDSAPQFDEAFGAGASVQYMETATETSAPLPDAPLLPAEEEAQAAAEDGGGVLEHVGDVIVGAARGTAGFFESGKDLVEDALGAVGLPNGGLVFGEKADNGVVQYHRDQSEIDAKGGSQVFGGKSTEHDAADNLGIPETSTVTGALAEGVTQIAWGFVGPAKFIKGAGFAASLAKGAVADFVSFGEHEKRMSDFVQAVPALQNPVTNYLQSNEADGWVEGRLKNAVEGLIPGAAFPLFLKMLRGMKNGYRALAAGDNAGADAAIKAAQADVADALASPGVAQAVDESAVADALVPPKIMSTADELASRGVVQRLDEDAVAEIALRIANDRGRGLDDVSDVFNIGKWDSSDSGKEALNEVIGRIMTNNPEEFGQVQTIARVRELVANLGGTPADEAAFWRSLSETSQSTKTVAAMVYKAQAEIAMVADQLPKLAQSMLSLREVGDEAGAALLREKLMIGMNVYAQRLVDTKGLQTNMARGTAIGRAIKELGTMFSSDPYKSTDAIFAEWAKTAVSGNPDDFFVKMAIIGSDHPHFIMRAIRGVMSNRVWEISNEFFINSILSGPTTHAINIVSNTTEALLLPAERALGSAFRGDLNAVRGDLASYAGLVQSSMDSLRMAAKSAWNDVNALDPAHATNELTNKHAIHTAGTSPLANTINLVGKGLRLPSRLLASEDEFFKQINYRARLYSDGYRAALEAGADGKAAGKAAAAAVERGFDEAGAATNKAALEYARRATFTNDLGAGTIGNAVQTAVNLAPPLRMVAPFVRTPTNLIRNTLSHVPVANMFVRQARENLLNVHGSEAQAEEFARLFIGSNVLALGAYLASEGIVTGAAPTDPKLREQWKKDGKMPYAFNLFGKSYSFQRGDPRWAVLGLAADAVQIFSNQPDNQKNDEIALTLALSLGHNLASKTYLTGITDTMEALTGGEEGRFERWWQRQAVARTLPMSAFLRQVNPDKQQKEAHGYIDALMANVPGFSQNIPAHRDAIGEVVEKTPAVFGGSRSTNVLDVEIASLKDRLPVAPRILPGMKRIDLTAYKAGDVTAFDERAELMSTITRGGHTLRETLTRVVQSSTYQRTPDLASANTQHITSPRAEMLSKHINKFRDAAWKTMLRNPKWKALAADVKTERLNKVRVPRRGEDALKSLSQ